MDVEALEVLAGCQAAEGVAHRFGAEERSQTVFVAAGEAEERVELVITHLEVLDEADFGQ